MNKRRNSDYDDHRGRQQYREHQQPRKYGRESDGSRNDRGLDRGGASHGHGYPHPHPHPHGYGNGGNFIGHNNNFPVGHINNNVNNFIGHHNFPANNNLGGDFSNRGDRGNVFRRGDRGRGGGGAYRGNNRGRESEGSIGHRSRQDNEERINENLRFESIKSNIVNLGENEPKSDDNSNNSNDNTEGTNKSSNDKNSNESLCKTAGKLSEKTELKIGNVVQLLIRESKSRHQSDFMIQTIVDCASLLPLKSPVYATLTALLNESNQSLGQEIIQKCWDRLNRAFDQSNHLEIKLLIRFFCELSNAHVVKFDDIVNIILKELLSNILNEYSPLSRRDYFCHLLLKTIPSIGPSLKKHLNNELNEIFEKLEEYMRTRESHIKKTLLSVSSFKNTTNDALRSAYEIIRNAHESSFSLGQSCDPTIIKICDSFEKKLSSAKKIQLSNLRIPEHSKKEGEEQKSKIFRYPIYTTFPILSEQDLTKDFNGINLLIIQDYIDDILVAFGENSNVCANQLHTMFCHSEPIIVQQIFSRMFELPQSQNPLIFYGRVLLRLCNLSTSYHPFVGKIMNQLFTRCEEIDVEVRDRFVEWFSFHLSNTNFKWPWKIWQNALELPYNSPKYILLTELIDRIKRLSFNDRIKQSLPEPFHPILELTNTQHTFEYGENSSETKIGKEFATQLLKYLEEKKTPEEISSYISSIEIVFGTNREDSEDDMDDDDDDDDDDKHRSRYRRSKPKLKAATQQEKYEEEQRLKLEIFFQCLLHIGTKSDSNIIKCIETYSNPLKELSVDSKLQHHMLKVLSRVWKNNPQMIGIITNKLFQNEIIKPTSIIDWIFDDEKSVLLQKGWIWQILFEVIDHTILVTNNILNQLVSTIEKKDEITVAEIKEQEEKKIEEIQNQLTQFLKNQKEIFLFVFKRFSVGLSDILANSYRNEEEEDEEGNIIPEFDILSARFLQTGRKYIVQIEEYLEFFENDLFGSDNDRRITDFFFKFKALHDYQIRLISS